jgi:hypothetical protein
MHRGKSGMLGRIRVGFFVGVVNLILKGRRKEVHNYDAEDWC